MRVWGVTLYGFHLNKRVKETHRQHGATFNLLHQEWEVYEPHRPGQKGGQEKGVKKEQEAENDGESGSAEDEGPQADHQRHGEAG